MNSSQMASGPDIENAAKLLAEGQVVGLPTETVYGLAARIDRPDGIEAIFKTKERPFFDPLIVHIHDISQVCEVASVFNPVAKALAAKFWPGPLTLVLPKASSVNSMITAGLDTVGIRLPRHPVALQVLKKVGVPLAAPSANKFGKTSPTSAAHVRSEFKNENVFVLEGGSSEIGIESTVLSVKDLPSGKTQLAVLRPGHILKSEIEDELKSLGLPFVFVETLDRKESPGHMKHHYMPSVPFILCEDLKLTTAELIQQIDAKMAELPEQVEGVKIAKPNAGIQRFAGLKLETDPVLAARSFYGELRRLAEEQHDCLVLYRRPSDSGERWKSLYDRIEKAASLIIKTKG